MKHKASQYLDCKNFKTLSTDFFLFFAYTFGMSISLSDESWEEAEKFVTLIEPLPKSLVTVSKLLSSESDSISDISRASFNRLVISPVFAEPIESFSKLYLDLLNFQRIKQITELSANDLFGILLAIYIYGKMKTCLKPEDLAYIQPRFSTEVDIACALSLCFTGCTILDGIFVSAGKFFALSLVGEKDIKLYTEYRRFLRTRNFVFDKEYELEKFGCTLEQIASACFLSLGATSKQLEGYVNWCLSPSAPIEKSAYKFWIINKWINSLILQKSPPDMEHKVEFYPPTELQSVFFEVIEKILSNQTGLSLWLEKN